MKEAVQPMTVAGRVVNLNRGDIKRFWSKIKKTDECWLWSTPTMDGGGYGMFFVGPSRRKPRWSLKAHRLSWTLANGQIPDGLHVLHHCDVRACCNPAHLFLGTNADNVKDKINKGRMIVGSKVPHAKLAEEDIPNIQKLHSGGMLMKNIATVYGVDPSIISRLINGFSWRHARILDSRTERGLHFARLGRLKRQGDGQQGPFLNSASHSF